MDNNYSISTRHAPSPAIAGARVVPSWDERVLTPNSAQGFARQLTIELQASQLTIELQASQLTIELQAIREGQAHG